MPRTRKAVILLSGGLDSATALYWARSRGYDARGLLFDYGQRHDRELRSAMALCQRLHIDFELVRFSLPWRGSSLLDPSRPLPHPRSRAEIGARIPSTYVPGRNAIFLAFGASYAEAEGCGARILAPLLKLTKSQIITMGLRLGVPYELTWSCYQGGRQPCGACDSCLLRAQGFAAAGTADPALPKGRR
ncbi:MAG: 7-cyano-7-deazaguanine synthase [Candidatus Edwardsbacteria bacterium]|nr:7-cyano-7-deazaguanine synthase [Candidatus Edwardsbacteria bacterium]